MTLSGATTPGQSGPGSNGNEGVLRIPQSHSITGTSPSDCLVSYPGHSLGRRGLSLCREAVGIFYSPSRLGKSRIELYNTFNYVRQPLRKALLSRAYHRYKVVWMGYSVYIYECLGVQIAVVSAKQQSLETSDPDSALSGRGVISYYK